MIYGVVTANWYYTVGIEASFPSAFVYPEDFGAINPPDVTNDKADYIPNVQIRLNVALQFSKWELPDYDGCITEFLRVMFAVCLFAQSESVWSGRIL